MAAPAAVEAVEVDSSEGSDADMDGQPDGLQRYTAVWQPRREPARSGAMLCGAGSWPQRLPGPGAFLVLATLALATVATWLLARPGRPATTTALATQGKEELRVDLEQASFATYTPAPVRITVAPGPLLGAAPRPAGGAGSWAIDDAAALQSLDAWPDYGSTRGPERQQEPLPDASAGLKTRAWGSLRAATSTLPPVQPVPAPPARPMVPAPVPVPTLVQAVPAVQPAPTPAPDEPPLGPATYTGIEAGVPGLSLLCYALMLPHSYEQTLLAAQHQRRVSLFACDEYALYSNEAIQVAPGLWTNVVDSDLKCRRGGEFKTALNTPIFMTVWRKLISERRYLYHDWTVKCDPDAVFMPSRLRIRLSPLREGPTGVYLNNCKFGLHGPLEVFSRNAVTAWSAGMDRCTAHFNALCSGPCKWGEDMFIDQCLMKVLLVKRVNDFHVLQEDHCDPPYGWQTCQNATIVAFHPFKDLAGYQRCLTSAQAVGDAA